uniref:Uncharacterized protein n=1 Tax=Anguilla anguilla TaxID=7936 RepID=A0A0E9S0Q3_ANGAN
MLFRLLLIHHVIENKAHAAPALFIMHANLHPYNRRD